MGENFGEKFNGAMHNAKEATIMAAAVVAGVNALTGSELSKRGEEEKSTYVEKIKSFSEPSVDMGDLFLPAQLEIKNSVNEVSVGLPHALVHESVDVSPVIKVPEKKLITKLEKTTAQESKQLPRPFSLEDDLRHDPNLAQFLQSWQRKNPRLSSNDRRAYSTDMNRQYADFHKETKLKIWTGLFNNPPETADVQMKKYYHKLIERESYREKVHEAVVASSTEFGVPLNVIYGVIGVESGGDMDKISGAGAVGVMQVKHDTALAEMIRITAIPKYQETFGKAERWKKMNVGSTKDNIAIGVAYLRYLYDRYYNWDMALMAYNSGPGHFEKSLVRLYNQSVLDKFSSDRERGLNRGQLDTKKPPTVIYDVVRKDFGKFLGDNYPSFAVVLNKAGAGGLNTTYVLKAMMLAETTRLAVEEGKIK